MGDENSQDGAAQRTKKFVAENLRKLFLGGVGPNTNEEALAEYFSKWSALEDSCILRDPKTKKSKGFAFVIFPEPEVVDEIMAARPHRIDGRNVEVKRPVPSEDVGRPESTVQSTKIFVGAIKEEMSEGDIEVHFAKFGKVVSVALVNDKGTGKKRGFGFVQFADHDCVDKCLLYRHEHRIKDKWIDVKKALSKAELAEVAKKAEEARARQQAAKRAAAERAREEAEAAKRAALVANANRAPILTSGGGGGQQQGYQGGPGFGSGSAGGGPVGGGGGDGSWSNRNTGGPQGQPDGGMNRSWEGSGDRFGGSGGGQIGGDGFGGGQAGWDNNRPQQGNWQGGGGQGPDMGGSQGGRGPAGGGGGGGAGWGGHDEEWEGPVGGGGGGAAGGASRPGMMGPNRYTESPAPRGPGGPGRNFDGPGGPGRNFDGPVGASYDFDGPGQGVPQNMGYDGPGPNRPFSEQGGGGGFGGDDGPGSNFDNRRFPDGPPRGDDWEGSNDGPVGGGGAGGGRGGGGRGGWNGPRGPRPGGPGPRGQFNRRDNQSNPRFGPRNPGGGGGFRGRF